tara:strand:- start:65469 stop:66740 length:1272 start_codon:yes stop_codon:yes gene_type:complete
MAQLSDDCFAFGGSLKPAEEALQQIERASRPIVETESIPLNSATGRVLSETLIAKSNVPPHDNAAVDGYAVYYDDLNTETETRLEISSISKAGNPSKKPTKRGTALRVFTGAAIIPDNNGESPDTIFMQEDCREENGFVTFPPGIKKGANKRFSGEDLESGKTVLAHGHRLRPQDIGIAATAGLTTLPVYRRLKVAILSTGDEIHEPGTVLPQGGVYDANRYTIHSLLEGLGCCISDLGIIQDDKSAIYDSLALAATENDAVITSGGVSTGIEDHVKNAVEAQGNLHFWRLAIRPGRPIALGQIADVPFIGLPGNPVAVIVTFMIFARPLLLRLGGCTETKPRSYKVLSGFNYKKKKGRREWLRVKIRSDNQGELVAEKFSRDGAGILSSAVFADGLIEIEEDITQINLGDNLWFLPFNEILR